MKYAQKEDWYIVMQFLNRDIMNVSADRNHLNLNYIDQHQDDDRACSSFSHILKNLRDSKNGDNSFNSAINRTIRSVDSFYAYFRNGATTEDFKNIRNSIYKDIIECSADLDGQIELDDYFEAVLEFTKHASFLKEKEKEMLFQAVINRNPSFTDKLFNKNTYFLYSSELNIWSKTVNKEKKEITVPEWLLKAHPSELMSLFKTKSFSNKNFFSALKYCINDKENLNKFINKHEKALRSTKEYFKFIEEFNLEKNEDEIITHDKTNMVNIDSSFKFSIKKQIYLNNFSTNEEKLIQNFLSLTIHSIGAHSCAWENSEATVKISYHIPFSEEESFDIDNPSKDLEFTPYTSVALINKTKRDIYNYLMEVPEILKTNTFKKSLTSLIQKKQESFIGIDHHQVLDEARTEIAIKNTSNKVLETISPMIENNATSEGQSFKM